MTRNFTGVKRLIVKTGTATLTHGSGRLNLKRLHKLAWVLTDLRSQGKEVILVSSGAIAVGAERLGLAQRPRDIRGKQAASAVGQAALMRVYEDFFMTWGQMVAQVLLTKDVFEDSARRTHAKNTFEALLDRGVIPIVNENDTVAVDELGFSDNDALSAYVARLVAGDFLVILSDIGGLYDADPTQNPDAHRLPQVDAFTEDIMGLGGESAGNLGTGGMAAKLLAARDAAQAGIPTVVASGRDPETLFDILAGKDVGTLFAARSQGGGS